MQSQCVRIPLKPEAAEAFVAFARSLNDDPAGLADVLREEGMAVELVFLDLQPEHQSVIIFTKAPDLASAHQAYLASDQPIQERMRRLAGEAFDLERATLLEVVVDVGTVG